MWINLLAAAGIETGSRSGPKRNESTALDPVNDQASAHEPDSRLIRVGIMARSCTRC